MPGAKLKIVKELSDYMLAERPLLMKLGSTSQSPNEDVWPGPGFADESRMGAPPSLYPAAAILSTWSERDWHRADGVQLDTLEHMQRVIVRTSNSVYEIFVRDGAPGSVLVRGGRFFQEFTEAHLSGSSLGGGFLKQYGIYVGLRLEFNVEGETTITSPVISISLCPQSLIASA